MSMRGHFGQIAATLAMILVAGGTPECSQPVNKTATPIAPWDRVENVQLAGFDRHFIVHVPPTFDAKRKLPVVIMLHGAGGTAQQAMEQTGWDRKADHEEFIAVFPDGVAERPKLPANFFLNPQTWN